MNSKQIESSINISQHTARKIIDIVSGQGNPPEYGFQYFTVGLNKYLDVIKNDYLSSFIKDGGSSFKMIVSEYGGGKTHFLYNIRELAWKENYMVAYIVLSPERTPFHKLEEVYKALVQNLIYPQSEDALLNLPEKGIDAVIRKWYSEKINELSDLDLNEKTILYDLKNSLGNYESISFKNAIINAFLSLYKQDDDSFELISQWLMGENPSTSVLKKFKIFEKVNKITAFKLIRSVVQWIIDINYEGLIVLMDEAEQTPSMSKKEKTKMLTNLRELIDECGRSSFKHTMWFYAVPDENFLNGRSTIYDALRQRVATIFDYEINPSGVKIYLEELDENKEELLKNIGEKLSRIYEIAYSVKFNSKNLRETIKNIAAASVEHRFETGYKRFFVQNIVKAFHKMRVSGGVVTAEDIGL